MAMGKPRQFPLDEPELVRAIKAYQEDVNHGVIKRPSVAGFCGRIGASIDEYLDVINSPNAKNAGVAAALKKFGTWMDGEIIERAAGPNASMSIFLLKQGFGGYKYTDRQEIKADGKVAVEVKFGGGMKDPFG